MKKIGVILALVNFLVACNTTSPSLTPRPRPAIAPKPVAALTVSADGPAQKYNPKVDVLFVIDNSKSMEDHVKNLADNIALFTNEIAKNKILDFHIAFTFVYDRSIPADCPGGSVAAPDRPDYHQPAGTLQPLNGLKDGSRRFVTRADDFSSILRATFSSRDLLPTFIPNNPKHPELCPQGAENEESMKPMLDALANKTGPNAGFRRDDAKFVAIIVSDAKDNAINSGLMSVAHVVDELNRLTNSSPGHRNFRVFSVAIKPGSEQNLKSVTFDGHTCTPDPAFMVVDKDKKGNLVTHWPSHREITVEDNPLAELAQKTEDEGDARVDQVLSICDRDYGKQLAIYGTRIQKDSLEDVVVQLGGAPQRFAPGTEADAKNGLAVFIGGVQLARGQWKGEIRDGKYFVIILAAKVDWNAFPNNEISVRYVKVDVNSPDARQLQ